MSDFLRNLSDAMAGIVESAGRSVVRVEGRRRLAASGVVWSAEGVILTAHHVVHADDEIGIGLPDGNSAGARLVGRDPSTDLAVLRTDAPGLVAVERTAGQELHVGHLVLALGRPGRTAQATLGIVSALGGEWRTPAGGLVDRYLQTDVVMYPGFSGGPLVDVGGRLVGMNTSALLRGVSLSVPVPTLERVVESLLTHGRVRRGYLGVGAQPVRLPQAIAQQLGQETGLLLASVNAGGPADTAGLLLGDTLVALDGQPLRHMDDLVASLGGERIGQEARIRLLRGGQIQEIGVVIGARP
ncbi:MAG: trypsin-like peptidase domain-containing protein [Anaerolineae bacterium]|jgi:S1-C subfamily serine protease|nr:trypsin-like peptidase domain-containing protein [Anaerolineae bacterium]